MALGQESNKKFRLIGAPVKPIVANLPVEVPNMVKILFRDGVWTPIGDGKFKFREEVQKDFRQFGILATSKEKNQTALDIEDGFV